MALEFSADSERAIARAQAKYPVAEACIMPVLDVAQKQFGAISPEVMALVAKRLGVAPEKVLSTATFYTMYNKAPVGRYHIQVCRNVSCYLRGADDILAELTGALGIGLGETTSDGLFTLSTVECLAACGNAPALQVNGTTHEDLTRQSVAALVDRLRREAT